MESGETITEPRRVEEGRVEQLMVIWGSGTSGTIFQERRMSGCSFHRQVSITRAISSQASPTVWYCWLLDRRTRDSHNGIRDRGKYQEERKLEHRGG